MSGLDQALDAAGFLGDLETLALLDGDAGGIIAAVFEALEPLEDNGRGLLFADVADDAAHMGLGWRFLVGDKI